MFPVKVDIIMKQRTMLPYLKLMVEVATNTLVVTKYLCLYHYICSAQGWVNIYHVIIAISPTLLPRSTQMIKILPLVISL